MRLRRIGAAIGLAFLLSAGGVLFQVFLLAWVDESRTVTLRLNYFGEYAVELVVVFVGLVCVPLLLLEIDSLLRREKTPREECLLDEDTEDDWCEEYL